MSEYRYKAFISYAHADRKWARWLHRSLESYRPPKHLVGKQTPRGPIPERLTPVFRDRDELPSAADLGAVLEQALRQSESLLVVCSPAAAQSRWVNEEIRHYRSLGRDGQIFCLIVDGEPNATNQGVPEQECFPAMLHEALEGDDSAGITERVAADVRPGGDGKLGAKLKIIAGMLGLGLDELRQREQQRRQKRLMVIAAAAVVGMVFTTALAAAALMARAEAERQRVRAEQQAETARQTSDFLVELFNVVDPGEARGREPLAREILDRGAERIERDLSDQPAVKANLQGTMGKVYTGLGLYDQAAELLEAALATGASVPAETANIEVRNLTALAEVHYRNGRYEEAAVPANKAVSIARLGDDSEALHDALVVQGQVLMSKDLFDEAQTAFEGALSLNSESDSALNGLGELHYYQGEIKAARAMFVRALESREARLGEDHPLTLESLANVAALAHMQLDLDEAEARSREALSRARVIFGETHPDTATYMNNLGRVLLENGELEEAIGLLEVAVVTDRARTSDAHEYLVFSLNNLALTRAFSAGEGGAEDLYLEALEIARGHQHRMQGSILANLGDLRCRGDDPLEGFANVQAAQEMMVSVYGVNNWRLHHAASIEGACLVALGRRDEALPLLQAASEALQQAGGEDWLFARLAVERLARADPSG